MPDLPTLRALKERLDAATGPLDAETAVQVILAANNAEDHGWDILEKDDEASELIVFASRGYLWSGNRDATPDRSIDAAVALVERALAGVRLKVERSETYTAAYLVKGRGLRRETHLSFCERPDDEAPLAILSALFAALIAKEEGHG